MGRVPLMGAGGFGDPLAPRSFLGPISLRSLLGSPVKIYSIPHELIQFQTNI